MLRRKVSSASSDREQGRFCLLTSSWAHGLRFVDGLVAHPTKWKMTLESLILSRVPRPSWFCLGGDFSQHNTTPNSTKERLGAAPALFLSCHHEQPNRGPQRAPFLRLLG